ncbi:double-strand break reduction protein RcbA [Escherichia coli]|nr:double-strand break reduction protein RcbA [Escherichia coli]EEZ2794317.1 double-strand break reduction protein RcbA [Escherichia coli]EFC7772920.1 double-strand break reduction protein RcbA [Escherichia coli]EFD1572902.1 double-strand break reduction protein RcbA [Escherichia coli]EFD9391442.1 double-strand break reduction protein RcbA [Escherichia coli]
MYKITATIEKEGGTPTKWTRYSKSKLTKSECEKMLSGKKEAGVSREQKVKLINFNCEKLQSSRIALYSN